MVRFEQNNVVLISPRQKIIIKKSQTTCHLVIFNLLPQKTLKKGWFRCNIAETISSPCMPQTRQGIYPFTHCILFSYSDKTKALLQLWRHCHKRLKPTPQLAMFASVLLLLSLKHCKAWSSASMNDLDSFFDINLDSFFDINEWEWSNSWLLNNIHCPIKTHVKGHRKEKTRESRHSYTAKAKNL